ncbi:predicted protein [Nematostella vectensis]|uniref:alanine transaminase n=1 Tax=Nematostella vectensis TaxID=45351 RepID=A7SLG7_NEMVE|nr:alanine aminotransferase 2-like [Nematostella vectensis]EDO35435.1 predicted protein [Nematostella vectensis]|eukprot:XP_001627535.1 predicted protein [Nematostella vectensis]
MADAEGGSGVSAKIITSETINPAYKRIKYGLRGPLDQRSQVIEEELAQGQAKPFTEVVKHIGDPQGLQGQKPITFMRQVLCLLTYPDLLQDERFPSDVKKRVREILSEKNGGTISSYTSSQGLKIVRQQIADFISTRDGYPEDLSNIYLTNGGGEAIRIVLKALMTADQEGPGRAGVMIPIPEYPLYSGRLLELNGYQIPYFLNEDDNWQLEMGELQRALNSSRPHCVPRALVLINPGNPTGQVLTYENIREVIKFCHRERLVLFADEVYQDNIYADGCAFHSCRKVLHDLGEEYRDFQLVSLHCSAKSHFGECALRGGYYQLTGFDEDVKSFFHNRMTLYSCPNIYGQVAMGIVCQPPKPGDDSYALYDKERTAIQKSMKEKAGMTTRFLNSLAGIQCNTVQGAMYAFPRVLLPDKAIQAAKDQGLTPDSLYASELLEATGQFVAPGSVMGQKEGTYHFRITIIPPLEKTVHQYEQFKRFHEDFMKKYEG